MRGSPARFRLPPAVRLTKTAPSIGKFVSVRDVYPAVGTPARFRVSRFRATSGSFFSVHVDSTAQVVSFKKPMDHGNFINSFLVA